MTLNRTALYVLTFAAILSAQITSKRWAGPDEYELGSHAMAELDPTRKLELLDLWVTRYPTTDFERDRLIALSLALRLKGQIGESLNRAAQALILNTDDPAVLALIATLGPMLQVASEEQRSLVESAAVKLLSIRITNSMPVTSEQSRSTAASELAEAEAQRVLSFIRQLRSQSKPPAPKDPEVVKREIAEAALQWARSAKR